MTYNKLHIFNIDKLVNLTYQHIITIIKITYPSPPNPQSFLVPLCNPSTCPFSPLGPRQPLIC